MFDAVNREIWNNPLYGKDLSEDYFAQIMRDELTRPEFVQSKIINLNDFNDKKSFNLHRVTEFIRSLAHGIDSVYSKISFIDESGNFEVRTGLSRNVQKSDYFVTDVKLSYDQLFALNIKKIYGRSGLEQNIESMDLDNRRNTFLVKQYRIVTLEDGSSRALVIVTGERINTPIGYVDGIVVNGKIIRNALLTYIDGRCLLSEFFDPVLIPFDGLEFWINEQYWRNYENYVKNEYVDIYTVFSFTERNEHRNMGTLVHLTDPSTRSDNLLYELVRLEPHFQSKYWLTARLFSRLKSNLVCDPFQNRESIMVYGEDFTKDIFMEIFYDLFDPYSQLYKQRTQTLAMKFLSYLNGISYGTNFEEFSQGPSVSEINTALKKLSFTEAELQGLLRKEIDPRTGELVFSYGQTNKMWLKLLYDKITSYLPDDGSIYAQQRDALKCLGNDYHKIDANSIARNKEEFTVEEARMGLKIFESAKALFGHFTIRLMFANMIDYYGSKDSFGIKIVNRPSLEARGEAKNLPIEERQYMKDFLYKIGLIPSTFQYDRPVSRLVSYKSKNDVLSTVTFLFGFFYLESHIYLDIENSADVRTSGNTLTFSLGPLVALTASGGFNGKSLRSLSKSIGVYLERSFELYRSDNLDPTDVNILGKEFLLDQSRALDFLAEKIKAKIIDGHYYMDTAKNIWLANQLIEHARLGLIYEKTPSQTSGYLRDQLETFMDSAEFESRQNTLILIFNYLMPKSKNQFKLEITQNELVENGIVAWGRHALLDTAEYAGFKAQLLHQNSHNIRKYLTTLINVLGDGEKVRIFPLLDRGDANTGYEFFTDSTNFDWKILPNGETYFDIDLHNEKSLYMLQHIINLLYTGKFAFVVKKPTGTWNDEEMIFAFNRDGFLEPSELYSQNMKIGEYSTIFRGDNEKWRRIWIYPKGWSTSIFAANNDILSYINYIVNPTQDNKHINAFMREYMNRMELLFPGYRLTMYKYLFFNIKP